MFQLFVSSPQIKVHGWRLSELHIIYYWDNRYTAQHWCFLYLLPDCFSNIDSSGALPVHDLRMSWSLHNNTFWPASGLAHSQPHASRPCCFLSSQPGCDAYASSFTLFRPPDFPLSVKPLFSPRQSLVLKSTAKVFSTSHFLYASTASIF